MKPLVTLFAIIAMLAAVWSDVAVTMTTKPAAACGVCLTENIYGCIGDGMTYPEVCRIIGAEPTEALCTSGIVKSDQQVQIYTWTDASKRSITVCFRGGVFQHKDQAWI